MERAQWLRRSGGGAAPVAFGLATAACAVALLGAATALAPPWVDSASAARKGPVLDPRGGDRLPARPVRIRVRTGKRAKVFKAQLNGQPIANHFSRPSGRGVRRLMASPTFGLRHGKNRLRVVVRRPHARKRSQRVRFRVRRNAPLAAAGLDGRFAAGARVYLDGGRSRSHVRRSAAADLAASGGARSRLRHAWKLVSAPKGSPSDSTLTGARGPTPTIKPEVPGRYRLRLRVKAADGKTGSDLVDVRVDPPPVLKVDTMAAGDEAPVGIRVGDTFYPARDISFNWVQIVVLDRRTGTPVDGPLKDLANKSYSSLDDTDPAKIPRDLKRLSSDHLVIAANPPLPPYIADGCAFNTGVEPGSLPARLSGIGVAPDTYSGNGPGTFSAIGVPGTPPGQGTYKLYKHPDHDPDRAQSCGRPPRTGSIQGYLIRNNEGFYAFTPSDRVPYDTQATGSDHVKNVVTIGDQSFEQVWGGPGGFQVVVADSQTLAVGDSQTLAGKSYWFGTGGANRRDDLATMRNVLKQANDDGDKLIVVASRGVPAVANALSGDKALQNTLNARASAVVDQLERAGGSRTASYRALDPGLSKQTSYALVGRSNIGGSRGQEATADGTSIGDSQLSNAPLSGVMAPTAPNYQYEPQGTPDVGDTGTGTGADPAVASTQLNNLLVQQPTPWPEEDDPGRTAAIKWIGQQVFGTDDPRSQYWTRIYKADDWNDYAFRIQALKYPPDQQVKFTEEELEWAKAELAGPKTDPPRVGGEIAWLKNVNGHLEDLATPFSRDALASWAAFESIAAKIRDEVGVGPDAQTTATEKGVLEFGEGLISALPVIGKPAEKAFKAAGAVYNLVLFLTTNHGATDVDFTVKASELGEELTTRLGAGQKMLTDRIPDVIAADYGKLQAVGSCTSKVPADWASCPFDHNDWEFTQGDSASKAFLLSMKTWAYGSLLNARYKLYELPRWWRTTIGDTKDFWGETFESSDWFPFYGLPASASVAKPILRNAPDYTHHVDCDSSDVCSSSGDTWQIYALGYLSGDGTINSRWKMNYPQPKGNDPPPTDVIFKPLSEGGLGADPESFYNRYFPQTAILYNFPEKTSRVGWCLQPSKTCTSE